MASYPYASDMPINLNGLAASGATWDNPNGALGLCDQITVWIQSEGKYQTFALYDGVWYYANNQTEFNAGTPMDTPVELGSGFWYNAVNPFTWEEPSPYNDNL